MIHKPATQAKESIMKRSTGIFAALILVLAAVSMAFAAEGNARKGKYTYRAK